MVEGEAMSEMHAEIKQKAIDETKAKVGDVRITSATIYPIQDFFVALVGYEDDSQDEYEYYVFISGDRVTSYTYSEHLLKDLELYSRLHTTRFRSASFIVNIITDVGATMSVITLLIIITTFALLIRLRGDYSDEKIPSLAALSSALGVILGYYFGQQVTKVSPRSTVSWRRKPSLLRAKALDILNEYYPNHPEPDRYFDYAEFFDGSLVQVDYEEKGKVRITSSDYVYLKYDGSSDVYNSTHNLLTALQYATGSTPSKVFFSSLQEDGFAGVIAITLVLISCVFALMLPSAKLPSALAGVLTLIVGAYFGAKER